MRRVMREVGLILGTFSGKPDGRDGSAGVKKLETFQFLLQVNNLRILFLQNLVNDAVPYQSKLGTGLHKLENLIDYSVFFSLVSIHEEIPVLIFLYLREWLACSMSHHFRKLLLQP